MPIRRCDCGTLHGQGDLWQTRWALDRIVQRTFSRTFWWSSHCSRNWGEDPKHEANLSRNTIIQHRSECHIMVSCDKDSRVLQSHGRVDQGKSEVSIWQWQLSKSNEAHDWSPDEAPRTCTEVSQWAEPIRSDHLAGCDEGCNCFWNQSAEREECSPEPFLVFVSPRHDPWETQDQRPRRWKLAKSSRIVRTTVLDPQGLWHSFGNPDWAWIQRLNCRWRGQIYRERETSCLP